MSKILSYILFEPKTLPTWRTWDKCSQERDRYWYNIPALVVLNKVLYPEHEMRLYLSKNVWDNPKSKIFKTLEKLGNLKIHTINANYDKTEPMIWRMMPLWESGVSALHCRDLDSLPTEREHKYTLYFEKSPNAIGTMRTHRNHHGIKCRMLGGLCSYKPNSIPISTKFPNFQMYYSLRHKHVNDQDLMIDVFTKDKQFTKNNFLDYHGYFQSNKQNFPCSVVSDEELNKIKVTNQQSNILQYLKEKGFDKWAGEPVDSRGEVTEKILSIFEVKLDSDLEKFYKL
jgi:hypothetical protein